MADDIARTVVSFSELDAYRQCPFKHKLAYIDRWVGPTADNSALGKGSLYHRLMDLHYSTIKAHQVPKQGGGVDWDMPGDELLTLVKTEVGKLLLKMATDEGRDEETVMLLAWMYAGHVDVYGLDEQWDIIEVESTHIVTLLDVDGNDTGVDLKVKLDLLIKWKGRYWIVDHKSCGNLPTDKDLDWDDQFGLYMMALRRKLGLNIHGTIHSAARTQMNEGDKFSEGDPGWKKSMKAQTLDKRFRRVLMSRTDAELSMIEHDAAADATLAHSPYNHRRRHTNSDTCKWRCSFNEACYFGRRTGNDANTIKMLEQQGFTRDEMRN